MAGPKVTTDSSIGGDTMVSPAKAMIWSAGAKCPECGQTVPGVAKSADAEGDLEKGLSPQVAMNAAKVGLATAGYMAASRMRHTALQMDPATRTPKTPKLCATCGQPKPDPAAKSEDPDDDALQKLADENRGQIPYVVGDLDRIARLWENETTRPVAESYLQAWIEHGETLRKAISTAWLARAKGALKGVLARGGHPPAPKVPQGTPQIELKPSNTAAKDTAEHVTHHPPYADRPDQDSSYRDQWDDEPDGPAIPAGETNKQRAHRWKRSGGPKIGFDPADPTFTSGYGGARGAQPRGKPRGWEQKAVAALRHHVIPVAAAAGAVIGADRYRKQVAAAHDKLSQHRALSARQRAERVAAAKARWAHAKGRTA